MDQRKSIRNTFFEEQTEERRVPVVTRALKEETWPGLAPLPPMARPAPGSQVVSRPEPRLLVESRLRSRREERNRRERALLLCGGVIIALCATFFSLLWSKIQTPGAANPPAAAVLPQEATQSAAALYPPLPAGQTKILLLGSDQRPDDGGYRTDVIILLTLNPQQMTVSAVSFPRDLWVKVPSLYEMKINQVFGLGGFEAMTEMFQSNFGFTPDYYVLTNFAGFTQFVDQQGGVDVAAAQALTDICDLPQAQDGSCTVEPGVVHMDGATALWYVRSRYTSSDFDRLRRAQEVLYGLLKKMIQVGSLSKLAEIQTALAGNVQTNLSLEKAISFLPFAARVIQYPDKIERYAITEDQSTPSWSWDGMWILLPDAEAIKSLLQQAGVQP